MILEMEETNQFYVRIRRIHFAVLRLVGLLKTEKEDFNVFKFLLRIWVNFAFTAISSAYIMAFILDLANKRFNPDITSELVSFVGFHMRYFLVLHQRTKLADMLKFCNDLWKRVSIEEKAHVRLFIRKISLLTFCYMSIIWTTITLYVVSSQISQPTASSANETVERILPYPFFFDVQNSPAYELTVVGQICCFLTVTMTSVSVDTAMGFFIVMACGHLRVIQTRLSSISYKLTEVSTRDLQADSEKFEESLIKQTNVRQTLCECTKYHQEMLKFCAEISDLASGIFMIELISTTYNLSLIGILLAGDAPASDKLKFAPVLPILMTQLFLCQYPPDLLLNESGAISIASYFVPLPRSKQQIDDIQLMMMIRAQQPVQLKAGGLVNLSMESFGNMVTSAVTFFTVLRSFNEA